MCINDCVGMRCALPSSAMRHANVSKGARGRLSPGRSLATRRRVARPLRKWSESCGFTEVARVKYRPFFTVRPVDQREAFSTAFRTYEYQY